MSLSKKIFEDGLSELEVVFDFTMTKTRAEVWYKYSKHLEDHRWEKKIAACIKGCRKTPTLADILDIKGYYLDNIKDYKYFEPEEDGYKYGPIPDDIVKKMDDFNEKLSAPGAIRYKKNGVK